MQIEPHPLKKQRANVIVENFSEHLEIVATPFWTGPLTRLGIELSLEAVGYKPNIGYPRALTLTHRRLGRIAGTALAQSDPISTIASVETGQQIANYLASQNGDS